MELEEEMSKRYRERFLHKEVEVLFEEDKVIDGKIYQVGHTREYMRQDFLYCRLIRFHLKKSCIPQILHKLHLAQSIR